MAEHIRKAHPDHINLTGMDVRYFGNLLALVKTAAKSKVIPLNPMELLWLIRMEKLANRAEIIDIENEPQLPSLTIREIEEEGDWNTEDGLPPRIEPEPDVRPAIDVATDISEMCTCDHRRFAHQPVTGICQNCMCGAFTPVPEVAVFEDDGGYTGPIHD